jgi:hypothetical protein
MMVIKNLGRHTILESEKYDTMEVNELFSKLKSAEVDRDVTTHLESPTDSHNLALVVAQVLCLMLTHPPGCTLCLP